MKSSLITDKREKLKQFPYLNHSFTSESDTNLHIKSDNDDCFDKSSLSDEESIHLSSMKSHMKSPPIVPNGSFVVTKLFSHKSYKNFCSNNQRT